MKKMLFAVIILNLSFSSIAQYTTLNAHSHNDYENNPPFWLAYNNHFGSIEADIWALDGKLFVAHDEKKIRRERTLDSLYILPIVKIFRKYGGRTWGNDTNSFQLLIDIKTQTEPALSILVQILKRYPDVFDKEINPDAVRIVITGNRPDPSEFNNYPEFVYFDGLLNRKYGPDQLRRVPLYSENFRKFSSWNGTGKIIEKERIRLQTIIDSVHSLKKKIRFWNSPDDTTAWAMFMKLGIDYINTDHIVKLTDFLNNCDQ